jgi:hypothetical protein
MSAEIATNAVCSAPGTEGTAARKAAKADWNAAPRFPVASDPHAWSKAIAAAVCAGSTIDAAMALARHGVPVFPVSAIGQKKPLNAHGVYSATIDLAVVGRDFGQHPNALIAVPMGARTGVFAIDVDACPPHAHDGVGAWRALEAKHGESLTRVHTTASGGLHLIYRWPPDRSVGCPIKGLPPGVECKGEGGAIIFPPSARGDSQYCVVTDIEPTDPPSWLLETVAPIRRRQPQTGLPSVAARSSGDGSPYGLKALDNACAALANAGSGERDRAVGEHVLAVGSLAAGGELDERHALHALTEAGRTNPGGDPNYCDKIERAFETGKASPRTAPERQHTSKLRVKRRSGVADLPNGRTEARPDVVSRPSCPSCPAVPDQLTGEKKSAPSFDDLMGMAGKLDPTDELGVRAILTEALECGLSDFQIDVLIGRLSKKVRVGVRSIRNLLRAVGAEAVEAVSPEERAQREREDEERRKREADQERDALGRSCDKIASIPTLLAEMEAVVHRLGVVGEGAAIRGGYLAATSRLLRKRAISLLRRGAAAGGKNFLLTAVLRLVPRDSIVVMSSGSPMSLVYYGGEDEDALKHKVLYAQEAAILAEKNGVENPLTIMLRLLISEGCIDHLLAIPQAGGTPLTKKIKRNGPVAVIVTSARDNIESEMLTRLLTSDADESREQTKAVVKGILANDDSEEGEPDLSPWLDFQRLLELEAPYEVTVPFGAALYAAYEKRLQAFPNALQLRMRRDISGVISAIKTSAVLHKAQREKDAKGRIVATIDDYRHAYEAFDEGVSSLYGVKTRREVVAVVKAVEDIGGSLGESVKVTVAALRDNLGINSKSVAANRLMEATERGALELDEEKSGSGKGRPRYFKLLKTSSQIAAEQGQGVFPPAEDVLKEINCLSSVGSGHADKTDKKDETVNPGHQPTAPEQKTRAWSVRL